MPYRITMDVVEDVGELKAEEDEDETIEDESECVPYCSTLEARADRWTLTVRIGLATREIAVEKTFVAYRRSVDRFRSSSARTRGRGPCHRASRS